MVTPGLSLVLAILKVWVNAVTVPCKVVLLPLPQVLLASNFSSPQTNKQIHKILLRGLHVQLPSLRSARQPVLCSSTESREGFRSGTVVFQNKTLRDSATPLPAQSVPCAAASLPHPSFQGHQAHVPACLFPLSNLWQAPPCQWFALPWHTGPSSSLCPKPLCPTAKLHVPRWTP